jgi:mannose-1-phosphate guanylyltransferase
MILAAGMGMRLRPVTSVYAKPAVPFLNVPLLYYSVALLARAGVDKLVVNAHYKPEQIEQLISAIPGYSGTAIVSLELDKPLGSGGGIRKAREHLAGGDKDKCTVGANSGRTLDGNLSNVDMNCIPGGEDGGKLDNNFFLANGDEVILPKDPDIMNKLKQEHLKHNAIATILVMKHPLVGSKFGGVWADQNGDVKGFGKSFVHSKTAVATPVVDAAASGSTASNSTTLAHIDKATSEADPDSQLTGYHYIGLQILNDRIFEYLPDGESNILYDALAAAIAAGETVRIVASDFAWFETGNSHDFLDATKQCLELLTDGNQKSLPESKFLAEVLTRFAPESHLTKYSNSTIVLADRSALSSGLASINLDLKSLDQPPPIPISGFVVVGPGVTFDSVSGLDGICSTSNSGRLGKNKNLTIKNSVILANSTIAADQTIDSQIYLNL